VEKPVENSPISCGKLAPNLAKKSFPQPIPQLFHRPCGKLNKIYSKKKEK